MNGKELSEARRAAGRARWANVGERSRSRQMKKIRANGGGRPRGAQRCFCEANTLRSAALRAFDCCKRAGLYPQKRKR